MLAINALAPAIINGRLRAFMEASGPPVAGARGEGAEGAEGAEAAPTSHTLKFIVNVSAMEGRFYKAR